MATWRELDRCGVRLSCWDFGGQGRSVLLLHGLAGHGGEWAQTASWLTATCHVVAADARGHGRSERLPEDVSRDAVVADAAFVVEQLELEPAVVVGQSVGGLTALSLAARHPELVRALVLVEASPEGGGDGVEEAVRSVAAGLRRWPVPFPTVEAAASFFHDRFGSRLAAEAWTSGLERREDGWWPRFDTDVMAQMLRQALVAPSWQEWERVSCPTLIVRGENGTVEPGTAEEMRRRLPGAHVVEVGEAGHDLHLDRPDDWRRVLTGFAPLYARGS